MSDVNIASFTIASANNNNTILEMSAIKAYKYVAPSLTVAYTAPENVTVATGSVEATLAAEDGVAVTETTATVDLTDVETLYIKVANATADVVPCVTLADGTVITPVKATANTIGTDTYYVYQFVGISLTDAVVTYTGAANANVPA